MSVIDTIFDYLRAGQKHYGESAVTQFEHAVQCAMLAEREGASSALIAASLLHDLGHLVNPEDRAQTARREDCEHEAIAADYLERWFDDAVTLPVRLHVAAKRYLTARFAALPGARDAIRLRRWDERAKEVGAAIPALEHFRPHLDTHFRE
jgi:predicted HD phosphohydrolase